MPSEQAIRLHESLALQGLYEQSEADRVIMAMFPEVFSEGTIPCYESRISDLAASITNTRPPPRSRSKRAAARALTVASGKST
jgi:hypothetical protein